MHLEHVLKKGKINDEKLAKERSSDGDEEDFVGEKPDGEDRFRLRSSSQCVEHVEKHEARERHRCISVM